MMLFCQTFSMFKFIYCSFESSHLCVRTATGQSLIGICAYYAYCLDIALIHKHGKQRWIVASCSVLDSTASHYPSLLTIFYVCIFNLQRTKNSSCRRIRYRSNSFNAFVCQQSEQMAGTIQLFYLYEDKNSKNMYNLDKSKERKKSQTVERITDEIKLSFIDRPVGHVKDYTIRDIGLQIMNEYDLFQKLKLNYFMMARIFSK
ncbi:LOW QUALITY PROTEIN: hypothetical protein Smp_058500 [Schistosoma mansoni]|uniref:hypothetical protein n=1 Tax=Schistosoma mansoni TaxID=6183 RepID=UPI00022C876C|nr:LOW QUALITY PROTEIN: hypothetical protein Smp_058500 [Schistosoma mansoni]|eukprot:XP_018645865.1 LOW QUALITY PROTEIN: hypothetical protein Smp_058500 [Schistosoma mansoni]